MVQQQTTGSTVGVVPLAGQTRAAVSCTRCGGSGKEPGASMARLDQVTLADIVRGTGMSWAMVSRVFSVNPAQRRSPSLRTAKRIADYLGIDLDTLYRVLDDEGVEAAAAGRAASPQPSV